MKIEMEIDLKKGMNKSIADGVRLEHRRKPDQAILK